MKKYLECISIVLTFLKKQHIWALLLLIVLLGAFFKFDNFSDLARFNADQVRDAKIVDKMFEERDFPLLGPKAGGTEFKLGPAFYYLEYVSALVFGHTPEGMALIFPLLSLASIILFFFFFRFFFSAPLALGLSALYATSFYFTKYSRFAWNPNAIPFFLLVFLYLLFMIIKPQEKPGKHIFFWYTLLGLVIGIGTQLHTTLLLLLPVLFLAAHTWVCFREKEKTYRIPALLLTIGIALACHIPAFISDFQNDGANIRSFLQGTLTKTEKTEDKELFAENILLNGQFFIQGATYALTGMEPEKDWGKLRAYHSLPSLREGLLALGGLVFFVFGLYLLVIRYRKEKDPEKKRFLELVLSMLSLAFLLFLPIAPELNLRFFIVLLPLPYLFLGLLTQEIFSRFQNHARAALTLIGCVFLVIVFLNIRAYVRTYDLDDYRAKDQAYGGLSLGEGKRLAAFIEYSHERHEKTSEGNSVFISSFEFKRSLDYLLEKYDLVSKEIEEDQTQLGHWYLITENAKTETTRKKLECCYAIQESERIGRFTITVMTPAVQPSR